ncbi:MAG: flagellar motor switch protein FliM [Phycisphaerales bacterium]
MSDLLDQSEVDALLAAAERHEDRMPQDASRIFRRRGSVARDESVEVAPYDFKRPERVSKDQMRALRTLHESFARNFGASLSGFLRTIVEVRVATCEQMTYGEFINGLPNPTSFKLIQADDLEGQMCLEISPLIIYPIIDRLLGGTSQDLFIPQRPMTQIETRLISNVTDRGLVALSEAWESVRKLAFEVAATESNPQLVQIVPPNEVVVVIGLETKLSNRAGTMNLCIPYNVIEPVMDELAAQSWFRARRDHDSAELGKRLGKNLGRAPVRLSAVLAETTITLRDLANMQVGDLIVTEKAATEPVVLRVEGEPKYLGHVGRFKGSRALRITRAVRPDERC